MKYVWIFNYGQLIERAYTTKKGLVKSIKQDYASIRIKGRLVFDKQIEANNTYPDNIYEDPFIGSISRIPVIGNPRK